jgi:hypothetical protein
MPKSCSAKLLTNTTFFSDNLGTYIANGEIETNKLITNGDIILTGSITNGSNSITFTENTLYTNIAENFFIHGTGLISFQGTTYNIGQILSAFVGGGTISPYPSITYDASLNKTSYTGLQNFPANSIASTSINNTTFVDLTTAQNISNKSFTGTTIFSSIQLNSDLITSNGGVTILNSNLALINFLSGTSSNINTSISALQTKTTNISFSSNTTTIIGSISIPNSSLPSTAIINTAMTLALAQTCTSTKNWTQVQNFQNNIRLDGALLLSLGTISIPNSTLQKTAFISDVTSAVGANLTSLQNQINSINTDLGNYVTETELTTALSPINSNISTLQTKTQYISSTSLNTNILNNTNVSDLFISSTINGFLKGDFNNVITQCSSLTSNCQQQITDAQNTANSGVSKADSAQATANTAKTNADNAQNTANSALALAGIANGAAVGAGALATLANTTANGAAAGLVTLNTTVDGIEVDVAELQVKTTQLSYNPLTSRTTISQTFNSPFLEIGNLTSGFTQTATDQITLAGLLRCNNRVEINNTLELVNNNSIIVEGIINQDNANPPNAGVNQFLAPTNFNGNVIMTNTSTSINSATTQIGTNAVSTLNCNATAEFGGDITMLTNKNLRLKNIVPILLDSIYFGGEAGVHLNDDVVFNMKIEANRPLQINNTCQIGTTINRNTLNSYTTTTVLDANTGMTLTTPTIGITSPSVTIGQNGVTVITVNGSLVQIGQTLGINYLYGTTYVQNLYSTTGVIGAVGNVFQQFV